MVATVNVTQQTQRVHAVSVAIVLKLLRPNAPVKVVNGKATTQRVLQRHAHNQN